MTKTEELETAIAAAIDRWGVNVYTRRLADWFRKHPEYTTDTVPLELLAAEIRKALGWES